MGNCRTLSRSTSSRGFSSFNTPRSLRYRARLKDTTSRKPFSLSAPRGHLPSRELARFMSGPRIQLIRTVGLGFSNSKHVLTVLGDCGINPRFSVLPRQFPVRNLVRDRPALGRNRSFRYSPCKLEIHIQPVPGGSLRVPSAGR